MCPAGSCRSRAGPRGCFSVISLCFHLVHVAETTGVTQHWIPSSSWIFLVIPKLILVGMSPKPCVVLAGSVPVAVLVCVTGEGRLWGMEPRVERAPMALGAVQSLHCLNPILSRGELCLFSVFVPQTLTWVAGIFIPHTNKHLAFLKELAALFIGN